MDPIQTKILANPQFHALVAARNRVSIWLTCVTLISFGAFIAFAIRAPEIFGAPLTAGSAISNGMAAGFAQLVLAVITTGLYTRRANTEFDALSSAILRN